MNFIKQNTNIESGNIAEERGRAEKDISGWAASGNQADKAGEAEEFRPIHWLIISRSLIAFGCITLNLLENTQLSRHWQLPF
jgi:hypothetical protein